MIYSISDSEQEVSRYWQHFIFFKFENKEIFSGILETKNPLEILETFFKSENFFRKI